MAPRQQLHQLLKALVDDVYFQPPTNVALVYPCIIYKRDYADTQFADNNPYNHTVRYMITVIDKNPDSDIPRQVAALSMCSFNRFYTVDNLNHDVYSIYF
jgi:hypothetical protein